MTENHVDRRNFLKKSALASAGATLAFGFEEKALLARAEEAPTASSPQGASKDFPMGKLGDLNVSRVICGGNLISGFAHSRDLIYVSPLLKQYFTDEKVCETLELCEEHGINTAILRYDQNTLRIINKYWNEWGGQIQWICQAKLKENDLTSELFGAIDAGAKAVYIHGGVGDDFVQQGKVDLLGKAIEQVKKSGVMCGIAGHMLESVQAYEKADVGADFYMKTINSKKYWSAGPMPRNDSVWAETPEETIAFMKTVKKPWIGYKVLGAGAIHPSEGFQYAFENGADFICVGMFDFQITEDTIIARKIFSENLKRERAWFA
ncbi:MAG: twin-arginine translocation signal domain-containing protein [Candidatus Omnitrophota bacterium]|jgi:hypothetical protein|nr:MAG: twin-arginine translocation signal domain-containing protein [Candidatus Omnitrophota bacterium]